MCRPARADVAARYQTIAQAARYGHYVRIPARICRCLDYFAVAADRRAIKARLHAYYLFIGVVDDVLDSSRLEAGREILAQFADRLPSCNEETEHSDINLVTEVFKAHIEREIYAPVLLKLEELYRAVVRERTAQTMRAFIAQRRAVGRLTAELSYLLISPLLAGEHKALCRFFRQVGELGCLIDSVIDFRADARAGLLSFRPTRRDHLQLAGLVLREGSRVLLQHPRLVGLFLTAVGDDLLDGLHARGPCLLSSQLIARRIEVRRT
jgi:hypothetical protein